MASFCPVRHRPPFAPPPPLLASDPAPDWPRPDQLDSTLTPRRKPRVPRASFSAPNSLHSTVAFCLDFASLLASISQLKAVVFGVQSTCPPVYQLSDQLASCSLHFLRFLEDCDRHSTRVGSDLNRPAHEHVHEHEHKHTSAKESC